jgi:hypothetical protein
VPGIDARFTVSPYDYTAAERLAAALGVSHVLAQVLVRRGLAGEAQARAFLAAAEAHPLDAFGGLREAARHILGHVGRRSRITVHGDYDVDGVAATAVLVRALRTLGADVDWYLPSRQADGYGLAEATVERLAKSGVTRLVYTAVERDGMLAGPDLEALRRVADVAGEATRIVYSGGVSSLDDLRSLSGLRLAGLEGVIAGRALYEGRFTVAEGQAALDETGAPR